MPLSARRALLKRGFDLIVASAALLLLAPVLGIIAAVVLIDSGRPVLFRQTRIGRGGRPFRILKFRTMVVGAESLGTNVSPRGDSRITRCGRPLRHWYLDELPQLVNVIRGEMSVVGPRPETPEYVELLEPDELRVLEAKPGLVGPSTLQFMDEADELAGAADPEEYYRTVLLHERAQADLTYLAVQSLGYDLRVLLRQAASIVRSA